MHISHYSMIVTSNILVKIVSYVHVCRSANLHAKKARARSVKPTVTSDESVEFYKLSLDLHTRLLK